MDNTVEAIRIVTIDYYLSKPIQGLDPAYSELQNTVIRQVPIIRVFGSNKSGLKVCAHVHGVFPYFYIPFDETEVDNISKYVQQLACSLDKAINISLGKSGSKQQYVYRVVLVKGIPFYGYHNEERRFLKIYLYHPGLAKRAANLMLNGAIMGKAFQPHETHIPYILQFMIDYNLYGMSQLFTPAELLLYRKELEDSNPDSSRLKLTISAVEMDLMAVHILNRALLYQKTDSSRVNPGITSIWEDEKIRRGVAHVSELKPAATQIREYTEISSSDRYYREMLKGKLSQQTLSDTVVNLDSTADMERLILMSSPEEAASDKNSVGKISQEARKKSSQSGSLFSSSANSNLSDVPKKENIDDENEQAEDLDMTIVNEEMVLNLTQSWQPHNISLQEEDYEFLEIMRDLEENAAVNPDNDSVLAPCTQVPTSAEVNLNKKTKEELILKTQIAKDIDESIEDENHLDFSVINDGLGFDGEEVNEDEDISKTSNLAKALADLSSKIPQFDGSYDPRSRRRVTRVNKRKSIQNFQCVQNLQWFSNENLPKLQKLNILIKTVDQLSCQKILKDYFTKYTKKKECGTTNSTFFTNSQLPNLPELRVKLSKTFDKSYGKSENSESLNRSEIEATDTKLNNLNNALSKITDSIPMNDSSNVNGRSFTSRLLSSIIDPKEGPSNLHKSEEEMIQVNSNINKEHDPIDGFNEDEEEEEDSMIHSFYDKTLMFDTTITAMDYDSSEDLFSGESEVSRSQGKISNIVDEEKVVLRPKIDPPLVDDLQKWLNESHEPQMPIYKDFRDVTQKKEVGHNILQIGCDSIKAMLPYDSKVLEDRGLTTAIQRLRKDAYISLIPEVKKIPSSEKIDEYLMAEQNIVICPAVNPPTCRDAKVWLKAREQIVGGEKPETSEIVRKIEDESPAKIKRENPINILKAEGSNENEEMELDESLVNVSMHEAKSQSLSMKKNKYEFNVSSASPTALHSEDIRPDTPSTSNPSTSILSYSRRRRGRLSLSKKLQLKRSLAESPELSKLSDRNISSASPVEISSQSSNKSNDTSEISSTSVKRLLQEGGNQLNMDSTYAFNLTMQDASNLVDQTQNFQAELENLKAVNANCEHTYLTVCNLEMHVTTRDDLRPDPAFDSVQAIFYTVTNDVPQDSNIEREKTGLILHGLSDLEINIFRRSDLKADILVVSNELALYENFIQLMKSWDPDILSGYEIERASWGYLIDRGTALGLDMLEKLSRILSTPNKQKFEVQAIANEDPGAGQDKEYETDVQIRGRILLNVWKLIRHEIALTSYTFENVMFHIMHQRCPLHSYRQLTEAWYSPKTMWIVAEYYLLKIKGTFQILDMLDLIGRTAELAKLFGIQFYEVLSRGSQFRVESMMMRIAKSRNYVAVSPSVQQRARMKAPEYLPLILEPESRMYSDPLIVLDFQSLYPSVIIAYNYCFSTCLGRVEHLGTRDEFEFGTTSLKISPSLLHELINKNQITVSPCGAAFVTSDIRKGVLPQMLNEILDTRLMVKQSMKLHKSNKALQRVLHSRQLGLKLIANVTYGYTAANFSGRMPCVEIGDSVVSKGRETLLRAIRLVEENEQWRAKVVYGDTDSLFVLLPGRDRAQAFAIGQEIAEKVTNDNPTPVKLKLEKVYQPCILQTKKRYVGYMYESPDQTKPVYEAKGIETVRRDGCPAVAKMLEKTLRILFETFDVSAVKRYINRQFTKILQDEMSIQELIFAKEFRGINGYKPGACVPALELTRKWIQKDPRAVPLSGERVPFVIANGPPGLPLIRLVRSPYELLQDKGLKINSFYYITKVIIPPLNRCLLLIGADARDWFAELPRKLQVTGATTNTEGSLVNFNYKKSTIAQYFSTANCLTGCGRQSYKSGLCQECMASPQKTVTLLQCKLSKVDRQLNQIEKVCQSCCGRSQLISCISLDCPVLYRLNTAKHEFTQSESLRQLIADAFF